MGNPQGWLCDLKIYNYKLYVQTHLPLSNHYWIIIESLSNPNSIFINFSTSVKYQIILDYIINKLDDIHKVIFSVDCQETVIRIKIIINPKYGRETTIIVPIFGIIAPIDKLENNLRNLKTHIYILLEIA